MEDPTDIEILGVLDERSSLAAAALDLFARTFDPRDQHHVDDLKSEIGEKRLGLIAPFDFHLLVARRDGTLLGAIIGVYLAGVNAGLVNYLAVTESARGSGVGHLLRAELIAHMRADARRNGHPDLNWVLGEVRAANPWLRRLVLHRGAIPFDLTYFHPGMDPGSGSPPFVLYRQPVADERVELPTELVRQIIYSIYRRAYRVRYPLRHPAFVAMLGELEDREGVGAHPGFEYAAGV